MVRAIYSCGLAVAALAILTSSPARARDTKSPQRNFVELGAIVDNRYPGANDYRTLPIVIGNVELGPITLRGFGAGLEANLLPRRDTGTSIEAGPAIALRLGRKGQVPQVRALGDFNDAIEAGGFLALVDRGSISRYGEARLLGRVTRDVANGHEGTVGTVEASFTQAFSAQTFVGAAAYGTWMSDNARRSYFGVGPSQSIASGIPSYSISGGFSEAGLRLTATQMLSPRLDIFATRSVGRLTGTRATARS